jgi:putative FmdB family regulatory protein
MPEYNYRCTTCLATFKEEHGMKEKLEQCPSCDSLHTLQRLPSSFLYNKNVEVEKVGDLVKRSIEEFKKDLIEEKRILKEEHHE